MNRKWSGCFQQIFLMMLVFWSVMLWILIPERSSVSFLKKNFCGTEDFRELDIPSDLLHKIRGNVPEGLSETEFLTLVMLNGHFHPQNSLPESDSLVSRRKLYLQYKPQEYRQLLKCYRAVWEDAEYFPVASRGISYKNDWQKYQDHEGSGRHQGTDLSGLVQKSGYYPVISMTGGVVESTEWTAEYGNQIVIRSGHGGYYFYAHLSSYEKDFQKGESVSAGDILGYMGNTGAGDIKKSGKMPVFLHVGICVTSADGSLYTINPYAVLKSTEKKIRIYNIH